MRRTSAAVLLLALTPALLTACSSEETQVTGENNAAAATADSAEDLSGVCPATVVTQQDWEPQAEHGALYHLVGSGYTVDAERKRVSGPLVIDGIDTGVDIEVRAGGSAIGFQTVASQMYVDTDILLGAVTTDAAIAASGSQPVTAVVSPLTKSPQIVMWDPESHPGVETIEQFGATGSSIVAAQSSLFPDMLVQDGLIDASQIDNSYDGAPSRFVGDPIIGQQGFSTAEPYIYENEVSAWGKPVAYQLLAEVGYDVYPESLSVRTEDLESQSACLEKLVPILQRSQVDYLENPAETNEMIVGLVEQYNDGWTYSQGVADYAAETMREQGIVANDSTGPLGGIDTARLQSSIDTFVPILEASGSAPKAGITPADLADTRFVDPSVTLS